MKSLAFWLFLLLLWKSADNQPTISPPPKLTSTTPKPWKDIVSFEIVDPGLLKYRDQCAEDIVYEVRKEFDTNMFSCLLKCMCDRIGLISEQNTYINGKGFAERISKIRKGYAGKVLKNAVRWCIEYYVDAGVPFCADMRVIVDCVVQQIYMTDQYIDYLKSTNSSLLINDGAESTES